MNQFLIVLMLLCSGSVFAETATVTLSAVPLSAQDSFLLDASSSTTVDPGTVIAWGKDLVTLGEGIYSLVQKGKPTIKTEQKPVSILPRVPNTMTYVDVLDLEEASDPIKKKFVLSAKNALGKEVVRMDLLLVFQVAKYNGAGKYIINAILLPHVVVGYGFDFASEMRVVGASNKGTRADPVTALILNIHYQFGSFLKGQEGNDAITLTGKGEVRFN